MTLFFLFFISSAWSNSTYKIMTFNTMCDVCKGSDFLNFNGRLDQITAVIKKHQPDIIALQEVRTTSQIKKILQGQPQYSSYSSDLYLFSYADPTIIYNHNKLEVLEKGQAWLGPNENKFSLGWKFSLPRQFLWIKFKDPNNQFVFSTSHFDNRLENLVGSALLVNRFFKKIKTPYIFAADTNITLDMLEYKILTKDVFINAFDVKETFEVLGEYKNDREICYTKKGKKFPECRVDHVLLSKKHKWDVHKFTIDATKSLEKQFPSDHRAVITEISLNKK
jgi:endonuclease/exonuclease/phosphatase family metal-dependent hydrolase